MQDSVTMLSCMHTPIPLRLAKVFAAGMHARRHFLPNIKQNKVIICISGCMSCADPEEGAGGPDPPEKSQKYRFS